MRRSDEDPGLPIKFGPCSNAEYDPEPVLPPVLRRRSAAPREACERNARRLGMSRREFLLSICGAATTLARPGQLQPRGVPRRPVPAPRSEPGGRYLIPPEATVDPEPAHAAIGGEEFVFDIQGHLLEYDLNPDPERPGLLDAVPAAELRRGRPSRLLLDRQLHGADVPAIRHVDAGAVGAPDLSAGQPAVAEDHERDAPDRRGPLPRRARAAPRAGVAERGPAPRPRSTGWSTPRTGIRSSRGRRSRTSPTCSRATGTRGGSTITTRRCRRSASASS